ncbi:hypothetical protein T484DRAFT_1775498 [Baffinella frigidus]|nr:hypothetical protein T484DRAFT_1775498 [Cryptophyta sp. CCMP2293]
MAWRNNSARVLAALLLAVPLAALPLGVDDHAVADLQRKAIEQQVVDTVNSDKESTWVAGASEVFAGMSMEEYRGMLGLRLDRDYSKVPVKSYAGLQGAAPLPDSFNSYEQWPAWCHPIRNQERCGSCWAFAASEVLSDRCAIASKGSIALPD